MADMTLLSCVAVFVNTGYSVIEYHSLSWIEKNILTSTVSRGST